MWSMWKMSLKTLQSRGKSTDEEYSNNHPRSTDGTIYIDGVGYVGIYNFNCHKTIMLICYDKLTYHYLVPLYSMNWHNPRRHQTSASVKCKCMCVCKAILWASSSLPLPFPCTLPLHHLWLSSSHRYQCLMHFLYCHKGSINHGKVEKCILLVLL